MDLKPGAMNYIEPTQLPLRDPLLVEREKTHGSFEKTAAIAQAIKTVYESYGYHTKLPKSGQAEALDMIASKIARILAGNPDEKDHWDDIAGYAKLGSEACE